MPRIGCCSSVRTALAGLHENRLFRVLALASPFALCTPCPARPRPSPAAQQPSSSGDKTDKARQTDQTGAPPVRRRKRPTRGQRLTSPRLTLEFPVGPKVELRAWAGNYLLFTCRLAALTLEACPVKFAGLGPRPSQNRTNKTVSDGKACAPADAGAAALLLAACGLRPTGPSPRLDVHGRHLWAGLIGKFRLSRFAHHSR